MGILDKMKGKKQRAADSGKQTATKADAKTAVPAEKQTMTRGPLAREGAGDAHRILMHPIFTEKTARLQALNQYVFMVAPHAGKVAIAQAIRDLYGVKPAQVRVVVVPGKAVHFGKYAGKEKNIRKAIVTLKAGETLTVLDA